MPTFKKSVRALAVSAAILVSVLVVSSGQASAATAPASYPGNMLSNGVNGVTGYYCNVGAYMPQSVLHYAGTTGLKDTVGFYRWTGTTWALQAYIWSKATAYFPSGNQYVTIYWDNRGPSTPISFSAPGGVGQYVLASTTQWLINGVWSYNYTAYSNVETC